MVDEKWSARFRTHHEIRSRGAIGNLNDGVEIATQGVHTRLIAWPGNGFQTESVHVLTLAPGEESAALARIRSQPLRFSLRLHASGFRSGNAYSSSI